MTDRLANAPIGTKAPAFTGGHWYRTAHGWKWNGPGGTGSTFPNPGGDWDGRLIYPGQSDGAIDFLDEGDTVEVDPSGMRPPTFGYRRR